MTKSSAIASLSSAVLVGVLLLGLGACGSGCFGHCNASASPGPGSVRSGLREPENSSRRGPLAVKVEGVRSNAVELTWPALEEAKTIEVFVGPEPSQDEKGTLTPSVRVAKLQGSATEHVIERLAAATHVFVRLEARMEDGTLRWGNTHVRTLGGPGTRLATPLREVHAYGPDVLMLVLRNRHVRYDDGELEGSTGPDWQTGKWSVARHDGSSVEVRKVHRHSLPVGQPEYPVGFEQYGDGDVLNVDHRIFLELAEPLGSKDVLRVRHRGEPALDVRIPYSDRYIVTPLIQVNQLGYNPRASRRWAYVSGWMGDGGAADLDGLSQTAQVLAEPLDGLDRRKAVVDGLELKVRSQDDKEAGGPVRSIDLSSVPAADGVRYRVRIPGVGVSWPTSVGDRAPLRAFWSVARGLYHNRWCGDLDGEHTDWSRPRDHCKAYFTSGRAFPKGMFPEDTPRTDLRPLVGGHHDAGDFDIRAYHVVVAQYLMRAYEMNPAWFDDGQLDIPESGNGIPDLLDEALWSIRGWKALQDANGAIRAGVESHRHPAGIYFAHQDELPYWTFDPMPWHTAYVAALFAQAARLVAPYDGDRAGELRQRAVRAYESSVAAEAPPAYRLYAASELFALTQQARYEQEVRKQWDELDRYGRGAFDHLARMPKIYDGAFRSYSPAMADFIMGYVQSDGADDDIVRIVRRELGRRADEVASALLESGHAHRSGRAPGTSHDYGRATSTGRQGDLIYQALELGGLSEATRQRYIDALSVAADYALGANPAGYSWISGLGSRYPRHPLHLDSLSFQKAQDMPPIPGLPVFGPVDGMPGQHYYAPIEAAFHPPYNEHPPGNRVSDTRASVKMNEFTVWTHQAPMTLLFAALVGSAGEPPDSWHAGGKRHRATLPAHRAGRPDGSD